MVSTRSSKYDGGCSSSGSDDRWFGRKVRTVDDFVERDRDAEKSFPFDEVDVTGVVIRMQPQRQPSDDYESSARVFIADLQRRFFALSFRIDSKVVTGQVCISVRVAFRSLGQRCAYRTSRTRVNVSAAQRHRKGDFDLLRRISITAIRWKMEKL